MEKDEEAKIDLVAGLTPVDQAALAEFKKVMADEVIPEIVRVVEERRLGAADSRLWQLKH